MAKKRIRQKSNNPVGRPPMFKSVQKLEKRIDQYFKNGMSKRIVTTMSGIVEVPAPTITGLALYLGFCNRASMYDYLQRPEFSHTIKRAIALIEEQYEMRLHGQACTGAIFALKNFGWIDKTEVEHTGDINLNFSANGTLLSPAERAYASNN